VNGYAVWVATSSSAWKDCYTVATPGGAFSAAGDSGAAVVTTAGEVIGIVVGAAKAVGGCATALSYVQDIDAVTGHFAAVVTP
jgi:hypothetical protein